MRIAQAERQLAKEHGQGSCTALRNQFFSTEGANGSVGLLGLMSGVSGAAELVPPVLRLWWGCGSCAGWFALSAALTACEGVGASQDKCWGYPKLGAASGVHRLEMVHRSF